MWSLLVSLIALPSLVLSAPTGDSHHHKKPVCIIGAGPAGLAAAGRLKDKGISAVVFDRQEKVGGKCQSWYDEKGIFHPLGAAFFSNGTYTETVGILNKTDVAIEPFSLAGARSQYIYNFTSGDILPSPALSAQFAATVAAEIPRYVVLWNERFRPASVLNYRDGVPHEFTLSGAEWFRQNNFTALPLLLVNAVALYGYGDINIVPALYILKYFTPDIITAFAGIRNVYYMDFHKMFAEYTKKELCETPIYTSADVRCVDRSGPNPVLTYTVPKGNFVSWNKQECSSVIFAFPPNLDNLQRVGVDLTEEEHNTFANVTTHQYYSSAVELELPFGVSYVAASKSPNVPPPNDGEPVAILRLSQQSNVSTAWSWGPYEFQTEAAAKRLLIDSLSEINKDPRNATAKPAPFTEEDVKAFRKWDYFPHFDSEALAAGAYEKYNNLQGCKKTYYASGISGMEIVEWALRSGYDIVDRYF
ncbi:hypothetical protein COCC4DRAFT_57460 [Bipolaris maydis ATCC 48331]|uniref:Amine oxidase domain-containing protein n=2 Tax=Cochliobolus heterostrophus TaxID=5016 RepID=M2UUH6_COCH5|nr:uncharacterized protein COCC4DRAFT_57460 [Bipolaris maydis ATCC 48331]EMD91513.1 hypothetical protein COCHEDRAFT_1175523 [Bipolaris maydis C5]KAJ5027312.1 hypothetical protein J3E73DRAFT_381074 [Bipolaris maydis]ENI08729.1 hypothetical protein COCC4DRAFT_57460 [Bipolaris maydis ATCC 48331]KAJ5058915.1 hypothetical protein J3E74DRAFT_475694 [Bipolaris maydis]KAJ6202505.1 hypothetical protein J3E72DRAFT_230425 [Bipolaris maydis]